MVVLLRYRRGVLSRNGIAPMPLGPELWLAATHESLYGSGGWAFARRVGGLVTGAAGGERRASLRRMTLAALGESLADLPRIPEGAAAHPIAIHAAIADVAEILAVLDGKAAAPVNDLDLWAPILAATASRALTLRSAPAGPETPIAFLTAWAELTRERAMPRGRFRAVLPKPNLARVAWG